LTRSCTITETTEIKSFCKLHYSIMDCYRISGSEMIIFCIRDLIELFVKHAVSNSNWPVITEVIYQQYAQRHHVLPHQVIIAQPSLNNSALQLQWCDRCVRLAITPRPSRTGATPTPSFERMASRVPLTAAGTVQRRGKNSFPAGDGQEVLKESRRA